MRAMPAKGPRLVAIALAVGCALASAPARAQDYFAGAGEPISFEVDRPRSRSDKILIASLFGGSVLFAGVGLLFHLDSRDKSDAVSTSAGKHTGKVYTVDLDDTRRGALRSRNVTIASYAVSGGFLVGTFIAYLITDPGRERITVGEEPARLSVQPTAGGALVGTWWRF